MFFWHKSLIGVSKTLIKPEFYFSIITGRSAGWFSALTAAIRRLISFPDRSLLPTAGKAEFFIGNVDSDKAKIFMR